MNIAADEPYSAKGPTILIVEDDPVVRSLVRLHLRNAGYEVLEAEDAVEGGHLLLGKQPDLVVCDVDMPYLNGYEFVAALKADPQTRHVPVVFLTVRDDVADHAKKVGAEAYLRKPVRADQLLETVRLHLHESILTRGSG